MKEKTSTSALSHERRKVVDYVRSHLIGPLGGEEEQLHRKDEPQTYYLLGALFPKGAGFGQDSENEEEDQSGEDPITLAYQLKPASMGLSFFLADEVTPEIRVEIAAGAYEMGVDDKGINVWKRMPLATTSSPETHILGKGTRQEIASVLQGRASLVSTWRRMVSGHIVTVTLVNARSVQDKFKPEDVLHQVWIRCIGENAQIRAYPSPNRFSWDEEEEELALTYQDKATFAIGHGCAPMWQTLEGESAAKYVESSFIPEYEVPPVTANLPENHELAGDRIFSLQYLADERVPWHKKEAGLRRFIDSYEQWMKTDAQKTVPKELVGASGRIAGRKALAHQRMQKGLGFLTVNESAQKCFVLANKIMLMQMIHSSSAYGGRLRDANSIKFVAPDYSESSWRDYRWRPFQLAFQLLAIESVGNVNSLDRDVADLIWFPTGGGKTEAYLSVAAFELLHRRTQYGDAGGGTAVILRYTLRLLTTQQFQRAAALICACEYVRRMNPDVWGDEPFSLGLWVGYPTTPNHLSSDSQYSDGALQKYIALREQPRPENPFQLLQCPWCGTRIIPEVQSGDPSDYGVKASASGLEFYCPTTSCEFNTGLPIQTVDEALYLNPPSFLIGTIDKFARLAWADEPKSFFSGGAQKRRPPSLILQDELHLISGPLGTIAGLYEAAIDVVMKKFGAHPKYIAATATIRRAEEQVRKLYARDCFVFPPSGMRVEDSFFSREEDTSEENPGRLYIGVMGQYHTPVTSLVHTSAVLAQAAIDADLSVDAADGYWTQVIFHNSRRELGKTMTMSLDDIPKRAEVIAVNPAKARKIEPVEMSANIPSREIPEILERLKTSKDQPGAIDCLPCTNMFSVGVDVKRLGLIVMNGQPKTTSEYIQASSRVGRDAVPGLVVAFYPNNKARDRSQYESFVPYHQALYRAVEPTSVTPYALPAMERAVHAALVIVVRYCSGLSGNDGAKNFDSSKSEVSAGISDLLARMKLAERGNIQTTQEIERYLHECVTAWNNVAEQSRRGSFVLRYATRGSKNFEPLLVSYVPGGAAKPELPWPTLNSMRNVDSDCNIYIWGEHAGTPQ